jgi:hypothetical protein
MQTPQTVFMGYATLESLLHERPPATQLYLFAGVSIAHGQQYPNLEQRTFYLTVSLIDADGAVHYCRVTYGGAQVIVDHTGEPVGDCARELERISQRGDSLEHCVRAYIAAQGFPPPREASPTFPDGATLIGGNVHFVHYDRAANRFEMLLEKKERAHHGD